MKGAATTLNILFVLNKAARLVLSSTFVMLMGACSVNGMLGMDSRANRRWLLLSTILRRLSMVRGHFRLNRVEIPLAHHRRMRSAGPGSLKSDLLYSTQGLLQLQSMSYSLLLLSSTSHHRTIVYDTIHLATPFYLVIIILIIVMWMCSYHNVSAPSGFISLVWSHPSINFSFNHLGTSYHTTSYFSLHPHPPASSLSLLFSSQCGRGDKLSIAPSILIYLSIYPVASLVYPYKYPT